MEGLRIGEGNLAGKGVYAAREFTAGEVVIAFRLEPLTRQQFEALAPGEELFVHSYGGRRWLYPPPARWVNHADEPSCYQDFERSCDVALRRIETGEPITIDAGQETNRELLTFLDAYVSAQQLHDARGLADLISPDVVLWEPGRVTRGVHDVASALTANPTQTLIEPEWHVATGRWEALCSAEATGDGVTEHVSLFLRLLDGNWQVVYDHRG